MADLCTIGDVKRYAGITTDEENVLLGMLITAASGWAENYCNRAFLSGSYVEERIGRGQTSYIFNQYPVTAITSLSVDGVPIPQSTTPTALGWRLVNSYMARLIGFQLTDGAVVQCGYTAGYSSANLPAEITQAVIEIVALRFKERNWIGHKSKTLHGDVIGYTNADVPADVKKTLLQYSRVVAS